MKLLKGFRDIHVVLKAWLHIPIAIANSLHSFFSQHLILRRGDGDVVNIANLQVEVIRTPRSIDGMDS